MEIEEDIVLIAGPTASGKTALAIEIAEANDAIIVNTDSMQVYADLQIVTARPNVEEMALAPHFLFGHVDAATHYSVAQWLADVRRLRDQFSKEKRKTVFVGGTGLYFNALSDGLSPIPEIRPEIRDKWRNREETSVAELHIELSSLDPAAADALRPSDRQRILRALEVFESTGLSILAWQQEKGEPLLSASQTCKKLLINPERSVLHDRINRRFDLMVEQGALDEVKRLLARDLSADLPAMKAIGVPQLASHLRGEISLDEAIEKSKAASRQYAKRQFTWFRNSFGDDWETA